MKVKIKVTFDMEFDSAGTGQSNTKVRFDLPDHPEMDCPETVKRMVTEEIQLLCAATLASGILQNSQ